MSNLNMNFLKSQQFSKKNIFTIAGLIAVLIIAFLGIKWLTNWRYIVSTDDAYVEGDITSLSPRVSGYLKKIAVQPNHFVKQGDVLFYIDDKDYKIAVAEAEARLETQKQTIKRLEEQVKAKKIALEQAEAQKNASLAVQTNAESVLKRVKKLNNSHYATQADLENAQSNLAQANAHLEGAQSQIAEVNAEIRILEAQKAETESSTKTLQLAFEKAQNDLNSCTIFAPFDGVISNIAAKQGDLISSGQRLAALIPVKQLYIVANLKETQLSNVKAGQKATFTLDAIKNKNFEGRVLSLSPATGSVFSLLPPQNATGNFTKVIQRVPVRISIPKEALESGNFRAGLSVIVKIDTKSTPKSILIPSSSKTEETSSRAQSSTVKIGTDPEQKNKDTSKASLEESLKAK